MLPKWVVGVMEHHDIDLVTFLGDPRKYLQSETDYQTFVLLNEFVKKLKAESISSEHYELEKTIKAFVNTFSSYDLDLADTFARNIETELLVKFKSDNGLLPLFDFMGIKDVKTTTNHYVVELCYFNDDYAVVTIMSGNEDNLYRNQKILLEKTMEQMNTRYSSDVIYQTELFIRWCNLVNLMQKT